MGSAADATLPEATEVRAGKLQLRIETVVVH
jgi:hypothetical protein